jgi:hypothetical protein
VAYGNADIVFLSTDNAKIFTKEFISAFMQTWINVPVINNNNNNNNNNNFEEIEMLTVLLFETEENLKIF